MTVTVILLVPLANIGTVNAEDQHFLFTFDVRGSSYPIGIALDSSDNVYVAYNAFGGVEKYSGAGTLLGNWNTAGLGDIVIDKDDNVYVSDFVNHHVLKFNTDGQLIDTIGGSGSDDGLFHNVRGLATDPEGNLYVADQLNFRIQVFDPNGDFLFKFGEEGTGDGQLTYVEGVRLDSSGNVYLSDVNEIGTRIQKFTGNGEFIGWLGRCTGGINCDTEHERSNGFNCTEETCTGFGEGSRDGQLDGTDPSLGSGISNTFAPGLLIDSEDNLYVTEYGNHRVQKFTSGGEFVGWAGKCTGGANCDTDNERSIGVSCTEETCTGLGPGSSGGQFLRPQRLATNSLGNIYVLDARDQYDVITIDDEDNVVHVYGTSTAVNLTVNAVDLGGNPLNGVWTTIRTPDGTLLKSGFTPLSFNGASSTDYKVTVANYDGRIFERWQDDNSTDKSRIVNLSSDVTLTAIYDTGDSLRGFTSLTYIGTEEQPDLTVNAMALDGSKTLHMWTIIDPQSSDISGTTFNVYASNYKDRVFDHWEDGSTDRIRTLTIEEATTITAYYQTG